MFSKENAAEVLNDIYARLKQEGQDYTRAHVYLLGLLERGGAAAMAVSALLETYPPEDRRITDLLFKGASLWINKNQESPLRNDTENHAFIDERIKETIWPVLPSDVKNEITRSSHARAASGQEAEVISSDQMLARRTSARRLAVMQYMDKINSSCKLRPDEDEINSKCKLSVGAAVQFIGTVLTHHPADSQELLSLLDAARGYDENHPNGESLGLLALGNVNLLIKPKGSGGRAGEFYHADIRSKITYAVSAVNEAFETLKIPIPNDKTDSRVDSGSIEPAGKVLSLADARAKRFT